MVQKKRIAAKTKSKPVSKPAKSKAIKPPKATLNSIQLTLNKVVDKLGHHDTLFEKIDQRFDGMDQRFAKIDQRFDGMEAAISKIGTTQENIVLPALKSIKERFDTLETKYDRDQKELKAENKKNYDDLSNAIKINREKIETQVQGHEERISALESHPA